MTAATSSAKEALLREQLQQHADPIAILQAARQSRQFTADEAVRAWQSAQQQTEERKQRGVYYTCAHVAQKVVVDALSSMETPPERILEPSCGGGALITAILHQGTTRWTCSAEQIAARIEAWDLDPAGILLAQWRIAEDFGEAVAQAIDWRQGDTLAYAPNAPYDWILGNPPFGNAIERATRRTDAERARFARAFPHAARGAFDKCALFVEWAAQQTAPQGHITYILPQSWLSQPAGTHLRQHLAQHFAVQSLTHLPEDTFFSASVSTIAITLAKHEDVGKTSSVERKKTPLQVTDADGHTRTLHAHGWLRSGHWGAALHPFAPVLSHTADLLTPLANHAEFSAGASTQEAYEWAPHVQNAPTHKLDAPKENQRALLIAGRIDPFTHTWGILPTRYLGADHLFPVLPLDALSPRRQALHQRPRALLPTLSVALEATVDLHGHFIGAVSTICAWPIPAPHPDGQSDALRVLLLAAILNSTWCRLQYHCYFGALALQGGNTQVSKNKLSMLDVPINWAQLLDAPPEKWRGTDPAADPAGHAEIQRASTSAVNIEKIPLDKKVPSHAQFQALCAQARTLATDHSAQALRDALLERLAHAPRSALERGELDILLLALAPDLLQRVETLPQVS